MKRVIFLDVDGVLNCQLLYEEQHRWDKFKPSYWYWKLFSKLKWVLNGFKYKAYSFADFEKMPDPPFKERLKRFKSQTCQKRLGWLDEMCKELDLKIVISSVWRNNFSIEEWTRAFKELGFDNLEVIGVTETRRTLRGDEIKDWITKYKADDFVIIDDDSDMLPEQSKQFFQTDAYSGLTPTTLYKITRYFNKE